MGYGYARSASGRYALACDGGCGRAGSAQGVRKRPCPHKAAYYQYGRRYELPYCPAPALCSACYKRHGGLRGIHGESCREGAAASSAKAEEKQARLDAGEKISEAAWGSWCESVPEGKVGLVFQGKVGDREYHLVPAEAYHNGSVVLSEIEHEPWEGPGYR
jgi:hypothetical protein